MSNTYENIKQRILDNINIDIDKREGSFASNIISPLSEELAKAYINIEDILSLGFIEDTFALNISLLLLQISIMYSFLFIKKSKEILGV